METTTGPNEAVENPRSRRALLAGVIGGLGAWLVSAAERAMPVEAGVGSPIQAGRSNSSGSFSTELRARTNKPTFRAVQLGAGNGLTVETTSGRAVVASAGRHGTGVWAFSPNNMAVLATTNSGIGVNALAAGPNSIGVFADARGTDALALLAFGPSHFDGDVTVLGRLFVTQSMTFEPTSAPQEPSSGQVRLFAKDDGRGRTQLCVQFPSGAVETMATER
jgi:hypothetical protein